MRTWLIAALAALLLTFLPAQAQVRLDRYLKQDSYGRIKISPDGQYYAATVQLEDRVGLAILRRSDKKLVTGASGAKDSVIDDFWWASDDRVVIAMAERLGSRDQPYSGVREALAQLVDAALTTSEEGLARVRWALERALGGRAGRGLRGARPRARAAHGRRRPLGQGPLPVLRHGLRGDGGRQQLERVRVIELAHRLRILEREPVGHHPRASLRRPRLSHDDEATSWV